MKPKCIVVIGTPVLGFQFFGPFEDEPTAERFGELHSGDIEFWIAPLNPEWTGPRLVVDNEEEK